MSKNLTILLLCLSTWALQAQTSLSGIINHYTAVSNIDYCESILTVDSPADFQIGQEVLLIQMQGASINESNNGAFGDITSMNSAGFYERSAIVNIVGNQLYLQYLLVNNYDTFGSLQLVTVPVYDNATVVSNLEAQPWNGTSGGVLAFEVTGTLTVNAQIDASGLGFRGGVAESIDPNNCSWLFAENDFFYDLNTWRGAAKGEGIAAFIADKEAGKGAQANGGGGANDHNSGGGGGGNFSSGGIGGENDEPSTFGCDGFHPGRGGKGIGEQQFRFYMGGGGGAGHMNNDVGTNGGNGGGIIFIKADVMNGTNLTIDASGAASPNTAGADGGGGGGAGGCIILDANQIDSQLLLNVSGGNGSTVTNGNAERCMGPGGGGSGGVIMTNVTGLTNVTVSWAGGNPGLTINTPASCNNTTMGATGGADGEAILWEMPTNGLEEVLPTNIILQPFVNSLCEGDSFTVNIEAEGNGLEYQWQINEGAGFVDMVEGALYSGTTSAVLNLNSVTAAQDGFMIRCVLESNCFTDVISDEITLDVLGLPIASFDYTVDGTEVTFNNTSQNDVLTQTWDFGDSASSFDANPIHDYTMSGTYEVRLIVENDCFQDTLTQEVVIGILPSANFTVDDVSGCVPYVVFYQDNSSGGVQTWTWSFPGGDPETSNEQNPIVTYDTPGVYDASLAVTNAVGSNSIAYVDFINVLAVPVADFSFVTNGFTVDFSSLSTNAHIFNWDFGDGNSNLYDENPTHTYTQNGAYTVSLLAANDYCDDFITIEVVVMVTGVADIELEGVSVYPVPFEDELVLEFPQEMDDLEVSMFDVKGRLLLQKRVGGASVFELDVSGFGAGVYELRVVGDGGVFVRTVVGF